MINATALMQFNYGFFCSCVQAPLLVTHTRTVKVLVETQYVWIKTTISDFNRGT